MQISMTIRIKADAALFKDWTALSLRIRDFSSIVQNDLDVPPEAVVGWERDAVEAVVAFEKLIADTKRHVLKGSHVEAPVQAPQVQKVETRNPSDTSYLFQEDE